MSGSQQAASALGAFPYDIPVQGGQPISLNPSLVSSNPFTSFIFPTTQQITTQDTGDTGGGGTSNVPVTSFSQLAGDVYPNGIPAPYLQGLDLNTQLGVDTLAARYYGNNPNALPLDPSLYGMQGSGGLLFSAGSGNPGGGPNQIVVPQKNDPYYTTNAQGYAEPTQGAINAINQLNLKDAIPTDGGLIGLLNSAPYLALAAPLLAFGAAEAAPLLGLDAGAGAAAGGAGVDLATSDLAGITAGAGDIGGTAAVAGGASAADTLGSLAAFDASGGISDPTAAATALGANTTVGVPSGASDITLGASTSESLPGGAVDPAAGVTDLTQPITAADPFSGNTFATAPAATASVPGSPYPGLGSSLIEQTGVSPGGGVVGDVLGPTTTGGTTAGSAASSPSLLTQAGQFISSPTGKLIGAGLSAASLGKDLLTQNSIPGLSNIQQLAQTSATQGQILQQYLQNGTLPPAVQTSINAATRDGITAIKSKYAGMGASGSSAEAADIQRLQQNAVVQGATLADQLLQQGISETALSGQLYQELVAANTALNTQTGAAISALANALAGGGTTLRLAS